MVPQTSLEVLESAYPLQEEEELGPEKKRRLFDELFNLGDAETGVNPSRNRPEILCLLPKTT